MLVAHHVIDILRGRINRPPMLTLPGVGTDKWNQVAGLIEGAQKFDFGTLMFERRDGAPKGVYAMPKLTDDERSFWTQGLIPLPFSTCWYEFTLGGYRSGLLLEDIQDGWRARRLDYTSEALVYDGSTATAKYVDCNDTFDVDVVIDETYMAYILKRKGEDELHDYLKGNTGVSVMLAIYLTIMLHSRTTERTQAPAPPKVNKKRARNGHALLADHLIVTIVPNKYREASEREAQGTHRPPRLHWRRSHLRHYDHHTLLSKWVPHAVHDGKQGWWIAVIARQLVGRADLGEVSHEYRIAAPIQETA